MQRHKKFSNVGDKVDPRKPYITKTRKVNEIVLHCSANTWGTKLDAKYIDREHMKRWGENSGCGYHYVILSDGSVQKGRWSDFIGAHVKGHNTGTIGICYMGGLDKKGNPMAQGMNEAQYRTAKTLIRALMAGYNLKQENVKGHNEYPFVNKACPCTSMQQLRNSL